MTPSIDTLTVRMVRGQDLQSWTDHTPALADALRAERVAVSRRRPGVLTVIVERRNPFPHALDAAPIPATSAEVDLTRLDVGDNEYGGPFLLNLRGKRLLVVGASGAGKSSLLWNPLRAAGPMIRDGLLRVWMIDLKGGTETERGQALFHRWATTLDDAIDLLTDFRDSMLDRQAVDARGEGPALRRSPPETPYELLMIDELAMLTAYGDRSGVRDALRLLAEVLTQGRAADHGVAGYVQEPTKDVVDVRELFDTRICLGVTAASHVDMALGDGARDRGALADEIPGDPDHAGIGFVIDTGSRLPVRFRAGWVTDADIDDLATRCAPRPATRRRPRSRRSDGDGRALPRTPRPPRPERRRTRHEHSTSATAATRAPSPLAVLVGLAGLGALPARSLHATGHPVTALLALAGLGRRSSARSRVGGAGRVRERREDAADALAGAAWRAAAPARPPLTASTAPRRPAADRVGRAGVALMWAVTGWVIATWLRVTLVLTAAVAVAWLALGAHSGAFWLICAAAVLAELLPVPPAPARVGPRSRPGAGGGPDDPPTRPPGAGRAVGTSTQPLTHAGGRESERAAVNDLDLVASVIRSATSPATSSSAPASGCTCATRTAAKGFVVRVPRYEADTVAQLLDTGHLASAAPTWCPTAATKALPAPCSSPPPPGRCSPAGPPLTPRIAAMTRWRPTRTRPAPQSRTRAEPPRPPHDATQSS